MEMKRNKKNVGLKGFEPLIDGSLRSIVRM
ncbi:MAG: hypothetical protein A4E28_01041 [Methanocella sp. PtaU1.Bin125]|nr:MAG: hypothetical protein A4E28_01041 [Methanocella sp. PtaU1.Bin125]